MKEFYNNFSNPVVVDSLNCASPDIAKKDNSSYTYFLYLKKDTAGSKIILADYNKDFRPVINYDTVAEGNVTNPNLGLMGEISYETHISQISRIKYTVSGTANFKTTENENCNFKNPFVYTYPIATGSNNNKTSFFVAFDSDFLAGNNEIFIQTFYSYTNDTLINISGMEGNDSNPKVVYTMNNDTVYVAIVWLHRTNNKSEISIAKEIFNPIIGSVSNKTAGFKSFELMQNFPNPFNPSTAINYYVPKYSDVSIKVFDVLGKEVKTLVNEVKMPGSYKVNFNAVNLSGGVYFYCMRVGDFVQTRKMILLK